jgi:hypothetical protein
LEAIFFWKAGASRVFEEPVSLSQYDPHQSQLAERLQETHGYLSVTLKGTFAWQLKGDAHDKPVLRSCEKFE